MNEKFKKDLEQFDKDLDNFDPKYDNMIYVITVSNVSQTLIDNDMNYDFTVKDLLDFTNEIDKCELDIDCDQLTDFILDYMNIININTFNRLIREHNIDSDIFKDFIDYIVKNNI